MTDERETPAEDPFWTDDQLLADVPLCDLSCGDRPQGQPVLHRLRLARLGLTFALACLATQYSILQGHAK
jgi:hypothetical protein